MGGESAEEFDVLGVKAELFNRMLERLAVRVSFDLAVKLRGLKIFINVGFQLCQAEIVGGKSSQRLIKRGRDVADLEDQAGNCFFIDVRRYGVRGQDQKARVVELRVLNVFLQNIQAVNFGGQ